ncbi:MAG TPA: hypothetical protein VMU09_10955, partial [Acidimicrobiales bacterium]|nr:hypothetical protein [Acidimicrobiales bacterium]
MTVEGHRPGEDHVDADLVRSMALSSAELWHEILERLTQVQESQAALAKAISDLGVIMQNALGGETSPALAGGTQAGAGPALAAASAASAA